jgi:peptide/nickel transport system substrate-binding protein
MKRKSWLVAALVAAGAVLVAACSQQQTSTTSQTPAAPLVVDEAVAPASLAPIDSANLTDFSLLSGLYSSLIGFKLTTETQDGVNVTVEHQGTFVGNLAKSWSISKSGLVYTFNLRPGLKFASGASLNAKAVQWSLEWVLKSGTGWLDAPSGASVIKSIAAPNATTVVITLSQPATDFLYTIASPGNGIVDESVLEKHGSTVEAQAKWLGSNYAGSGPYEVKSYISGSQLNLVANPNYYGPKPRASQLQINFIDSNSTLELRARQGLADVTLGLSDASDAALAKDNAVSVLSSPAAQWVLFSLPNKLAPFNNVKVREALTYAVPYQEILAKVAYGYGQLYYGPYPPLFPVYDASLSEPRAFSLAKAKDLLAESGAKLPTTLNVDVLSGETDQEEIATILQAEWHPLGINLEIHVVSPPVYETDLTATTKTYAILRQDGPTSETPLWLSYDLLSNSEWNTSNYDNSEVDSLITQASTTSSRAALQQIYNKITGLWVADSPRITLYATDSVAVVKKGVDYYGVGQAHSYFQYWGFGG